MADSKVKDLGLAEFGRKEITLAEHEMPGLMNCRNERYCWRKAEERFAITPLNKTIEILDHLCG